MPRKDPLAENGKAQTTAYAKYTMTQTKRNAVTMHLRGNTNNRSKFAID